MAFVPAKVSDIRIGSFIKLTGSWFSHPFPTNSFKIKTDKELSIVRDLKNVRILYDPDQSDHILSEESQEDHDNTSNPNSLDTKAVAKNGDEEEIPPESPEDESAASSTREIAASVERHQAFEKRRESLIQADKAYKEVVGMNRAIIRDLKAGYVKGIAKAEEMVTKLDGILDSGGTIVALMNLMGENEVGSEFYYHSLNVSILSIAVGREVELSDKEVKSLGMGALLHDIGHLSGLHNFTATKSSLSNHEFQNLKRHPLNGQLMVDKGYGLDSACLDIIAEHHEYLDGSGYPKGSKGIAIHPLTPIVTVIDRYDELSNNPDVQQSVTPYEALCSLYTKKKKEFSEKAVEALIRVLGVFPPSSLVELSDGSIGMVCSINREDRMKPQIMMYSPKTPKDEAIIIDLSQDLNLTIKKSLRPSEVNKAVWDYLNPRGMISYFASPSAVPAGSAVS